MSLELEIRSDRLRWSGVSGVRSAAGRCRSAGAVGHAGITGAAVLAQADNNKESITIDLFIWLEHFLYFLQHDCSRPRPDH